MLLGIDLGTTGTMCVAYDVNLRAVAHAYRPIVSRHPQPDRVEQDPEEVIATVVATVGETLSQIGGPRVVQAAGVDNQGESLLAWDAVTGRALTPVLVWSDRRATEVAARIRRRGHAARVRELSGLELSDYFAAARMAWLLEHDAGAQHALRSGRLRFGTLDAWIALRLGERPTLTDQSTASRTQLLGLQSGDWEPELLEIFGVPRETLPDICPSLGDRGVLQHSSWGGGLPWRASLVDQPAALAGSACFEPGEIKISYGTGCFLLANAGISPPHTETLLASIAWSQGEHRTYALDGGVFTAGTALDWLVAMGLAPGAPETSDLAEAAGESDVRFLPAFTGMGAPWWDHGARGLFSGLTSGVTRGHLARAVLDAIALRVCDVAQAFWEAGQPRPMAIRADGGLSQNRYLMQRQADLLGLSVECGESAEATARGAATLAGLDCGLLTEQEARDAFRVGRRYDPHLPEARRAEEHRQWRLWLQQARQVGRAD